MSTKRTKKLKRKKYIKGMRQNNFSGAKDYRNQYALNRKKAWWELL